MSLDRLFEPLHLRRGPAFRNRLVVAPMTNQQNLADGRVSDDELRWLGMRARGGFAMVMTSATHIHPDAQFFSGELGISNDGQLEGLTRLALAIKEFGSAATVQIYHAGPRAKNDPVAPSADEKFGARALTVDEIAKVRDDFISAALRAQKAGFDGVEVHGAHGFLLCQFLSPGANRRSDRYGGSLENRVRLTAEIVSGIRQACLPGFQLGLRLSAEQYGLRFGEMREVAQAFLKAGEIDYLDMSLWDVAKQPEEEAFRGRPLMSYFTNLDRGRVKLGLAGKIRDAAMAVRCLDEGADFILMGRAALLVHDLPKRLARDPEFRIPKLPVSYEYLAQEGLGPAFIDFVHRWPEFADKD